MILFSEDYLAHHGILGQKWGVRRYQNADGTRTEAGKARYSQPIDKKTVKMAKNDAKEYARAQMSIGEGSGNRRKLIKSKVAERSKDPVYKEEFDRQLALQDMAKHADAARRERNMKDAQVQAKRILRTAGSVAVSAATIAVFAHNTGLDKMIMKYANTVLHK